MYIWELEYFQGPRKNGSLLNNLILLQSLKKMSFLHVDVKERTFPQYRFHSEDFLQSVLLVFSRFDAGMVGLTGLEPVTPRLSSACSNQLSYRPVWIP